MAFNVSPARVLQRLEDFVGSQLETNWAAEPPAARAALLVREALGRWTSEQYPGSTNQGAALDPDSRRRLSLLIHSAPVTHRVEVWGLAEGDEAARAPSSHTAHSWVVVVRAGGGAPSLEASGSNLAAAGLKKIAERSGARVALTLWQGSGAPDGCPDCQA